MRRVNWLRLTRDGLVLLGILMAVAYWLLFTFGGLSQPVDAHAYWVADPGNLYPNLVLATDGYYYPPPFELIMSWARLLPFEVFVAGYRAVLLAAVVYLAGPFTVVALMAIPVASEINVANIQILLALAVVLGFRYPGTWAFVLLTKVTPGVGLLWFAVRREWRALAQVAIATGALLAVSLVLFWDQWPGYIRLIANGSAPSVSPFYLSLWQRLPFAIGLVLVGAWRGWRWTVPVSAMLALPVFYPISLSMLVGVLPFVREWLGTVIARRGWSLARGVPAHGREPA